MPAKRCNDFRAGDRVHDSWWPVCLGRVVEVTRSRVKVAWTDGTKWSYDAPHLRFLVKEPRHAG